MKEPARDIKSYRTDLSAALEDTFQRRALDKFAVDYRASRERIYSGLNDRELIAEVAARKDESVKHLDELFKQFKAEAEKRGVQVHLARDAAEANRIIAKIAEDNGCKMVVKSKSMTVEEIQTNTALEAKGMEVVETDLAEWIIQLRHEGPSHMVMPAIHLSRTQVADTFTKETGKHQTEDITSLVRVARRELRRKFAEADMGISGMNFAVAESGAIGLVTNEGNARMVTTLPRVHVAVGGIDKLIPSFDDAMATLRVLPRNATGQHLTSYVTWIAGGVPTASAPDGKKSMHVVFVDNGRKAVLNDPVLSQALRCVRCGACANVCPVYRLVGGHRMGYIYIGAIGLILTYLFHGKDRAKALVQNCVNCQACKSVCAAGIDLPGLIEEIRMRYIEQDGNSLPMNLLASTLKNRKAFHSLLKFAKYAQRPLTGGEQFIRHLPSMFAKDNEFRALPAIADKSFRDRWEKLDRPASANPSLRVAIFAGCVQDFVYPEQLEAAVKLMQGHNIHVDFPMDQSCCGLPVVMMGQRETARDVALQNMDAFEKGDYDVILTLCASCASQLKEGYVELRRAARPPGPRKGACGQGHGLQHVRQGKARPECRKLQPQRRKGYLSRLLPPLPWPWREGSPARAHCGRRRLCPGCRRGSVLRLWRHLLRQVPRSVRCPASQEAGRHRGHRRGPCGHGLPRLCASDSRRRGEGRQGPQGDAHCRAAG